MSPVREWRRSGIEAVGDIPWGTHICEFYRTAQDMLDVLVPYFKAGLEGNEFCMWITSSPLSPGDAIEAMRQAVPDFDRRMASGQIEILPHSKWYMKDGYFDFERVFNGWISKLDDALARGYKGLRATGNTAWLESDQWEDFTEYEEALDNRIGAYRLMAVCTYSLDKCGASEVIDVVKNHEYALVVRDGKLELLLSTERRRAAGALRRAEERYKLIVETSREGVWIIDADAKTTFVNERTAEMLGYAREEMIGRPVFDFMERAERPLAEANLERQRSGISEQHDFRMRHRDGSEAWCIVSSSPLHEDDGSFAGSLAMLTDITERKRAETDLRLVNVELDGYARTVSHDLRGPLTAATLACDDLRSIAADAEQENVREELLDSVEFILRNIGRCYSLVDDLLALAQAGLQPGSVEGVDIEELIADILIELGNAIDKTGAQVLVSPGLGTVAGNRTQLRQVFSNLIKNAIKHNDAPEPRVSVERLASDEDGLHRFAVCDNGSGIPPEELDKVFAPFFKKGGTSETGIGLSIVQKLVGVYGGDVRAYNDGGACFEFTLRDYQA